MFRQKYIGILIVLIMFVMLALVNVRLIYYFGSSFLWDLLVVYAVILALMYPKWSGEFHLVGINFLLLMVLNCVAGMEKLQDVMSLWVPIATMIILVCVGISHYHFNIGIIHPDETQCQQNEIKTIWKRLFVLFCQPFLMGAFGYGASLMAGYVGMAVSNGSVFQPRVSISGLIYLGYALFLTVQLYYLLKIKDDVLSRLARVEISGDLFRRASRRFWYLSLFFLLGGTVLECLRQNWLLFIGNNVVFLAYGLSLWKLLGAKVRCPVANQEVTNIDSVVKIDPLNFRFMIVSMSVAMMLLTILLVASL